MGISKLGYSQELKEDKIKSGKAPSFTSDEVEVLKRFETLCMEKGVNADVLIEKLSSQKK